MSKYSFTNASSSGEIPSFNGSEKAEATDYANYFSSYAQLYHQKQMLADHNRMAAYHSAILGNASLFQDKIVMDVGTGSGILAVWAAQAGAKRVYAIEYTDMARYAEKVMEANGVSDAVEVIQAAVEDIECLPGLEGEGTAETVDIIISEWMGYFLLRESMLDTIIRARDKFLKKDTGLMFPSHASMYLAPVTDEEERKNLSQEYTMAMGDWHEFAESTLSTYGVDMSILERDYEKEQKECYLLSSRWCELYPEHALAEPKLIKHLDMITCTIQDARGILPGDPNGTFDFDIVSNHENHGPVSGFAGWFTADFKSRTDVLGKLRAPVVQNPALLSTAPDAGYTHWGQQVFYLLSCIPLIQGETTRLQGSIAMTRSKDNARLYDCRIAYSTSRRKSTEHKDGFLLMKGGLTDNLYQIP